MKTRLWRNDGATTIVQFRDDADPMVWLFCNIGWVPIGNAPKDAAGAEAFAVEAAAGYHLEEASHETALFYAGVEEVDTFDMEAEERISPTIEGD